MSVEQQRKPVFMINPPITVILNDEMALELHHFFESYIQEGRRIPKPVFAMWKQIESDLREGELLQ